jgi:hypothetical protein
MKKRGPTFLLLPHSSLSPSSPSSSLKKRKQRVQIIFNNIREFKKINKLHKKIPCSIPYFTVVT